MTDAARAFIAREGYDPVYGARPLRRAIQRLIENPLAKRILGGEFEPGSTVRIDVAGRWRADLQRLPGTRTPPPHDVNPGRIEHRQLTAGIGSDLPRVAAVEEGLPGCTAVLG